MMRWAEYKKRTNMTDEIASDHAQIWVTRQLFADDSDRAKCASTYQDYDIIFSFVED